MHSSIPIRHHYIPQFLLKQFCNNERFLCYCDKNSLDIIEKKPEDVFMVRNLYRDIINNPDNPAQLEKDFSVFEREASEILRKFLTEQEIIITVAEEEKLKLFLALMGIRSKSTAEKFSYGLSEDSKKFYSEYQEDGDFSDFWKRNLNQLVKCRSYSEVKNNPEIDEPIKLFMRRDTFGLAGLHFVIAEKRGKEDFIIGDSYPVEVSGLLKGHYKTMEYSIFPISSDRMLFMADNYLETAWSNQRFSEFERELKTIPSRSKDGKTIRYHVKKMYESEVKIFNSITFNGAEEGVAFKDRTKVSINEYSDIYANWKKSGKS